MIKHEALLKLASLKTDLEAAIASEYAKVCRLTGREFAEKSGLKLESAEQTLSRFKRRQPLFVHSHYREGHPFYSYRLALSSIKPQSVRDILKDFAYPFSYRILLDIEFSNPDYPVVTLPFLQSCIDTVENCEYEGIGEIRHEGRVFDGRHEVFVVKTGDISSWVMREGAWQVVVKSDTLPPQTFVMSNGKYTIDPPDERVSFNPDALEYHLACRHCEALGYEFSREGSSVVYLGKVKNGNS